MDTDSRELPPEAYLRELRNLDRTAEAVVWCFNQCKTPLGGPGFVGGGEVMLCAACEAERLLEVTEGVRK